MLSEDRKEQLWEKLDPYLGRPVEYAREAVIEPSSLMDVPSGSLRGRITVDNSNGYVYLNDLPDADPGVVGVLYSDGGTVMVSS